MVEKPPIKIVIWGMVYYLVGGLNPSERYESQLGWLFPTEWKNHPNVPNHPPDDDCDYGWLMITNDYYHTQNHY